VRRSWPSIAAILVAAAALPAPAQERAQDESRTLKLLPDAREGQEETIELEASVERPRAAASTGDVLKASLTRRVLTIVEGRPWRERLTLEKAELAHYEADRSGTSSRESTGLANEVRALRIERSGRARGAVPVREGFVFPGIPGLPSTLANALRRDPDELARIVEPKEPMAPGDEWNVDRADLLDLVGPARARLRKHGSRAVATLESFGKTTDGKAEAKIRLVATLRYATDDGDSEAGQVKVKATLEGPFDGSSPPRVEETTVAIRRADDSRETRKIKLVRTLKPEKKADSDREDGKDDKERAAPEKSEKRGE
jgi:hypothetical protein